MCVIRAGAYGFLEYTCLPSILDSVPGLLSPALAPRIDFAVRIFTIYVLPEGKGSKRKIKWRGIRRECKSDKGVLTGRGVPASHFNLCKFVLCNISFAGKNFVFLFWEK